MSSRAISLLRQTIKSSGLSQGEIARRVQITPGAISKYLSGDSTPSIETFEKILSVCGASVELRQDTTVPVAPVVEQLKEPDSAFQASIHDTTRAMRRFTKYADLRSLLVKMREQSGKTQTQLSAEIGYRQATISAWEIGRNEPTIEQISKYAEACGYSFCCDFQQDRDSGIQTTLSAADRVRLEGMAHALSTVDGIARDILTAQIDAFLSTIRKPSHTNANRRR